MNILNRTNLCRSRKLYDAVDILERGLVAANPVHMMQNFVKNKMLHLKNLTINLNEYNLLYIVAIGKAAYSMSVAIGRVLPIKAGIIVIPHRSKFSIRNKKFQIYQAGHPSPDQHSVVAAKQVLKFLNNRRNGDFVLFLISGGASSLVTLPDGITLSDKMHVTHNLLTCGASIAEINCVRKHISKIKGGNLIKNMTCDGASLIMSDVECDDPEVIASGITYMDSTTFDDAINVVKKYNLNDKANYPVMERLKQGADGCRPETPKSALIPYNIIANNYTCLTAMEHHARSLGYNTHITQHYDNIQNVANALIKMPMNKRTCIVFGGEPTVHVRGHGQGGRNLELVLRLMAARMCPGTVVASMGTDGIDGNTQAAGAVQQIRSSYSANLKSYLENNDSYSYFEKYGGLIKTGHTGSNLQDIGLILR